MGLGICTKNSPNEGMPGWVTGAVGYHADDGCLFEQSGQGQSFGPHYSTGDTVGCGIDFHQNWIFFTRNGTLVGMFTSGTMLIRDTYVDTEGFPFQGRDNGKLGRCYTQSSDLARMDLRSALISVRMNLYTKTSISPRGGRWRQAHRLGHVICSRVQGI